MSCPGSSGWGYSGHEKSRPVGGYLAWTLLPGQNRKRARARAAVGVLGSVFRYIRTRSSLDAAVN